MHALSDSMRKLQEGLQELETMRRARAANPLAYPIPPLPKEFPLSEFKLSPEVAEFIRRNQINREKMRHVNVGTY